MYIYNLHLTYYIFDRIKSFCTKYDMTFGDFFTYAICFYLEQYPKYRYRYKKKESNNE